MAAILNSGRDSPEIFTPAGSSGLPVYAIMPLNTNFPARYAAMILQQKFSKLPIRRPSGCDLILAGIVWPLVIAVALATAAAEANGEQPTRIRVLSYNIHHALGIDGKLDLERIANVILETQADIVALQEVDSKATRSGSVDQAAELARLAKMNYVFGSNIPLQGGHYGNAVLTRFSIVASTNHLLPCLENGEQRGVIEAELEIAQGEETVTLFATHLDHRRPEKERVASAVFINKLVGKLAKKPALLAGDLNDVMNSNTLSKFGMVWTPTNDQPLPTIPVANPKRQIDFILYRPAERWRVIETKTIKEPIASDHLPILTELELQTNNTRYRQPGAKN